MSDKKMSIIVKALIAAGAAVLCAIGSCAGFLSTLNMNGGTSFWNGFFGIAFVVCAGTFLGALFTATISAIVRAGRRTPDAGAPQ